MLFMSGHQKLNTGKSHICIFHFQEEFFWTVGEILEKIHAGYLINNKLTSKQQ